MSQATMELVMAGLGVLTALVGGYFVARKSNDIRKVRGGTLAEIANYVVSAAMAGIPVALLVTFVVTLLPQYNLFSAFVTYVLVNLIVVIAALLVYGVIEPDAEPEEASVVLTLD